MVADGDRAETPEGVTGVVLVGGGSRRFGSPKALPDASDAGAPIAGVVAGLRAARHPSARAVPQTGPLPRAYTRAMLPELERRPNAGELSPRGA